MTDKAHTELMEHLLTVTYSALVIKDAYLDIKKCGGKFDPEILEMLFDTLEPAREVLMKYKDTIPFFDKAI